MNGSVYFGPLNDKLQAFRLTNGLLSTTPTLKSAVTFGDRGASMAASANGTSNAILWALQRNGTRSPAVLYAYDPAGSTNGILKEIYISSQAGSRDTMDVAVKFTPPTVANGRVYVPRFSSVTVYGLLP